MHMLYKLLRSSNKVHLKFAVVLIVDIYSSSSMRIIQGFLLMQY